MKLFTLSLLALPVLAVPAIAVATPAAAAAAPVTVARYSFDGGAPSSRVAELSGRGTPLTVRTVEGGRARFVSAATGRRVAFPKRCASTATSCPRALLEGRDDADLDPGTRRFRWGATVNVTKDQVVGSSNVMQKGVVTTESQWKMQISATRGFAHCVVVGRGSTRTYIARASVTVADGRWHKVLCSRAGSTLSVYVDGRLRGKTTVPAALTISNDKPLRIGGPNFNTPRDMYHGYLDDVFAVLG